MAKNSRTSAQERFSRVTSDSVERIANSEIAFAPSNDQSACEHCRNNHGFSIPHSLIRAIRDGDAVVFAGAGISTENRLVTRQTLYERVCTALKLGRGVSFPDALQQLADRPNGRLTLVEMVLERIRNIELFRDQLDEATKFHRELATMFSISTIVTTNWDTFFEDYCGCQPFVLDKDTAFWDSAKRRVLKIHGSIMNLSTLVATRSDYDQNLRNLHSGLIGSHLKTLLSGKTVVFFGYSLRDEDFNEIMTFVRRALGSFSRQHYIVTIDATHDSEERFKTLGLAPIYTDATFFLKQVKAHLLEDNCINPDSLYEAAADLLSDLRECHSQLYDRINIQRNPEVIFCASYQDGYMHALMRLIDARIYGDYSDLHAIQTKAHSYRLLRAEKLLNNVYEDVAYIDGYLAGMHFAILFRDEDALPLPFYYVLGRKPHLRDNLSQYRRDLKLKQHHRAATARARKLVDKLTMGGKDLVYEHRCEL